MDSAFRAGIALSICRTRRPPSSTPVEAPPPTTTPEPTSTPTASGADGFKPTAYLEMKVDRVSRNGSGIQVSLTGRSTDDVRRGVGHDIQDYAIVGSNGVEYRSDGNVYSPDGRILNHTIWMAKDAEAQVSYMFRGIPANVTAARLILRERYGDRRTTTFDLPQS